MRSTDVFQGVGDSTRLRRLLMPEAGGQSACVGEQLAAAVDELEGDLAEFRERLELVEARVETRLRSVEAETPGLECEYLVYLATPDGYRLTEERGAVPAGGDPLAELDAAVLRVGLSPLPGDSRPCVFAISRWTAAAKTLRPA